MSAFDSLNQSPFDILVVDDSHASLKLLVSILGKAGYRVCPANSGELALRSVQAKLPSLILLDIKMPGLDGYEVCMRLKADEKTRSIPVVFTSALDNEADHVKGFEVGGEIRHGHHP
ncbi:MAG: response regulator [Anaerolineales bacterium]|nr:response regulator [Anaerolineales bacterium]